MSKKFLKIFGVCVMAILLPVLVVVSVVCLTQNSNQKGPADEVETYTVYSDYADETTVIYDEINDIWKISAIPTRDYYDFTGVKVNNISYSVSRGVVVLTDEEKEMFERDVRAKREISSTWDCQITWLDLFGEYDADAGAFTFLVVEKNNVNLNAYAMETTGLLIDLLECQDNLVEEPVTKIKVTDNNSNVTATLTIADEDRTETGDVTIKTVLDKLAADGITLELVSKCASITIA